MARAGVTYQEVAEVATSLVGQGKNPTVEQIRITLGTGSSTTIANHLRQWRSKQEANTLLALKENIPTELLAAIKGLWERLVNHSEAEIHTIQQATQQAMTDLQLDVDKYKLNNQRWQKMFEQWQQEKAQLESDLIHAQEAIKSAHQEAAAWRASEEGFHRQLQEKQERIEELHKLHQQTQANLEHYRESTREQRLLDEEKFEREKQQIQLELKRVTELFMLEKTKYDTLKNEHQQLTIKHSDLQSTHEKNLTMHEQLNERIVAVEQEKSQYYHESLRWQSQYQDLQEHQKQVTEQLIQLQSELKAQQKHHEQAVHSLQQKNESLLREKQQLEHHIIQLKMVPA